MLNVSNVSDIHILIDQEGQDIFCTLNWLKSSLHSEVHRLFHYVVCSYNYLKLIKISVK